MTPSRPRPSRRPPAASAPGFTLVEAMVVVAIVLILSALVISSLARSKPRANLANATLELHGLLHQARQAALSGGVPVSVLVYRTYAPPGAGSPGYFVVYQDACFDFFTGGGTCGVSYAAYDPANLAVGSAGTTRSAVLDTMTLPSGVIIGPATGMGAGAALNAPLAGIVVNLDCSFCGTTGGAVQFDPRGQATFYSLAGGFQAGPLAVNGGASLTLGYDPAVTTVTGQRTLVVLSASGAVQIISGG